MIELNEAFEILVDPDQRSAYDAGGLEATRDAQKGAKGSPAKGEGFKDFHFYESFGLYDDDPQIQIIDYHSWEASHSSTDAWFIVFYSPRSSMCEQMAEDWRRVGSELHDSFNVGAVNCDENFPVCRSIGIQGLPTVILYTKGTPRNQQKPLVYHDDLTFDGLYNFAMQHLPNVIQPLLPENFSQGAFLPHDGKRGTTWVVGYCIDSSSCDELGSKLKLISMILNELVPVAQVNCEAFSEMCLGRVDLNDQHAIIITYHNHDTFQSTITRDIRDIAHEALGKLGPLPRMDPELLQQVSTNTRGDGARMEKVLKNPREFLILAINQDNCVTSTPELGAGSSLCYQTMLAFRQVMAALKLDWEYNELVMTTFNCDKLAQSENHRTKEICESLKLDHGQPEIILLKEGALNANEYHDRIDRPEEILAFVQQTYRSTVHELDEDDFEVHINQGIRT